MFPLTQRNVWTMTKLQHFSSLLWLELPIASQMQSMLTTRANSCSGPNFLLSVVLHGWLKVWRVPESKHWLARRSTDLLTLRQLKFPKDFQRAFWTREAKKDNFWFLYSVAVSMFSLIGRATYSTSQKENAERLKVHAKRKTRPLSSIASFEREKQQCLQWCKSTWFW